MSTNRFLFFTIVLEGGLGILAILLASLFGLRLSGHLSFEDTENFLYAFFGTLFLLLAYFFLKKLPFPSLKKVEQIVRLFYNKYMSHLTLVQLAVVAALAGFGEELFFRGLIQTGFQIFFASGFSGDGPAAASLAIAATSVLFGLAHAVSKTYFFLAFLISIYLGSIYCVTGNIFVPIFIHGFYDFFVFLCLRAEWKRRRPSTTVR